MIRNRFRLRSAVVGGAACLLLASCSTAGHFEPVPETGATLTGTVTFKHELLKIGTVLVQGPAAGAQGKVHDDGHYTVENVPLGPVTIAVTMGPARGEVTALAAPNGPRGNTSRSRNSSPSRPGIRTRKPRPSRRRSRRGRTRSTSFSNNPRPAGRPGPAGPYSPSNCFRAAARAASSAADNFG